MESHPLKRAAPVGETTSPQAALRRDCIACRTSSFRRRFSSLRLWTFARFRPATARTNSRTTPAAAAVAENIRFTNNRSPRCPDDLSRFVVTTLRSNGRADRPRV